MRFSILALVLLFILLTQVVHAAEEIRWTTNLTSRDGSTVVRLRTVIDTYEYRVVGFFQPDGKVRRIMRVPHSIERYDMSSDGYFGAEGEEWREDGVSGKVFFLYCPLGHLVWKTDLGKMAYCPPFAIAENGNAVAVYLPQPANDPLAAKVLNIFDADGKEVRSMLPPASIQEMGFLDSTTLLETTESQFCAVNVITGALLWENDQEAFDFGRGPFMALSSDKTVFLIIDFFRTKTDADVLLTPRMRIFSTQTGELLAEKTFEKRSHEKVPDGYHIRYDAERRQFRIEEMADLTITY